jgi:predicted amino acid racemase/arginase family enzyme
VSEPRVTVDLQKIERNARTVVETCRRSGIEIFGVTKGTCGMPQVARAMLRAGVIGIGESRFENIRRLRASGIDCPILLLRSPPRSLIEEVVSTVDISLNSELAIIGELARVAERMARVHQIILMVDLGDLREGIWPRELLPTVEKVQAMSGVRIVGLGTNLSCFGAVIPSPQNMGALADYAAALERQFGLTLRYISGGNSSSLPLLLAGGMPSGVNNLRIGEAILQGGRDTFYDQPWKALDRSAFVLSGELLEVKVKPSVPIGETGVDAFGQRPVFEDRGERLRGILNIGREDVVVEGLQPLNSGIRVLGASSDHLVLDLTDAKAPPSVGDRVAFHMNYAALLATMTSEYVEKRPMLDQPEHKGAAPVMLLVEQALSLSVTAHELPQRFAVLGRPLQVLELGQAGAACQQQPDTELFESVATVIAAGGNALLMGTDHALTLAGLQALSACVDALGLLWLDARPGFSPPDPTGAVPFDESVLYRALGLDANFSGVRPQLSPENVVLIGLRDVSAQESKLIQQSRVTVFTIADVDALGIREVMRQALRVATAGTRGIYLSYSPAVTDIPGTLEGSGGITLRETHQAMEIVAASRAMIAMDAVHLRPDSESRIVAETSKFIMSAFGKQIL